MAGSLLIGKSLPPTHTMKNIAIRILALAFPLLAASCATWPRIEHRSIATKNAADKPEKVTVPGIADAVKATARDGGSLHLFLVHGMSNHPFGPPKKFKTNFEVEGYPELMNKLKEKSWREKPETHANFIKAISLAQFDPLVPNLAKTLKLVETEDARRLDWYEDEKGIIGYKMRRVFEGEPVQTGQRRRLVVHLSAWAPVTIPEKLALLESDNYPQRNFFIGNRVIKDASVSWGLADAAQYVGKNKGRMRAAVAMGIESMAREANLNSQAGRRASQDRFAFGAASLGSIITLDTLQMLAQSGGAQCFVDGGSKGCVTVSPGAIKAMFSNDMPLYMFANQIPLLAPAIDTDFKSDAFAQKVADITGRKEPRKFLIVAFNDPSDFLGYRVPHIASSDTVDVDVVNLVTRNQSFGVWFFLNNPLQAHGGFALTSAVMDFIAKGGTIEQNVNTGRVGPYGQPSSRPRSSSQKPSDTLPLPGGANAPPTGINVADGDASQASQENPPNHLPQ